MRSLYYDRQGAALDTLEWAKKFEDRNYTVLAIDAAGPLSISTIWVGLDHSFGEDDPPLIFETAGFVLVNGKRQLPYVFAYRYATEAEALRGHAYIVEAVRLLARKPELSTDDILAQLPDCDCPNEKHS
jgi:hypothetical protein